MEPPAIYPKSDKYDSRTGREVEPEAYQAGVESARRDFQEIADSPDRIQLTIQNVQNRLNEYDEDDDNLWAAGRYSKHHDRGYLEELINLSSGTGAKMARKFIKKSAPFGGQPPRPAPPTNQQAPPPRGPQSLPSQNSAPGGATTPPAAPGGAAPTQTPPATPQGVTQPPGGLSEPPGGRPRGPGGAGSANSGSGVPTDVKIDMATGAITIKGPGVNITFAKYDPSSPPDKVSHLPEKSQRQWVHVYNTAVDNGDDEETAHKKAWGAVPDKGKKTKESATFVECPNCGGLGAEMGGDCSVCRGTGKIKEEQDVWDYQYAPRDNFQSTAKLTNFDKLALRLLGTHKDWIDFKANDNEPQYGDWEEETQYSKDTHDNMFANPKNRMSPPTTDIKATVPDFMEPRAIAYSLQTQLNLDVDVDGDTLTIRGVSNPIPLLTELQEAGLDANATENLTKYDQGFEDLYKLGKKVAIVGDYPDMNYYYDSTRPAAQAMIVGFHNDKAILENDQWGRFEAERWEIDHVR
jgi:cation transport regulator ChaB